MCSCDRFLNKSPTSTGGRLLLPALGDPPPPLAPPQPPLPHRPHDSLPHPHPPQPTCSLKGIRKALGNPPPPPTHAPPPPLTPSQPPHPPPPCACLPHPAPPLTPPQPPLPPHPPPNTCSWKGLMKALGNPPSPRTLAHPPPLTPSQPPHPPPPFPPPPCPCDCLPRSPPNTTCSWKGRRATLLKPGDYPDDANMCTHFRKPWKKGAKVTSRDKVYELLGCHIMPIQSIPTDYVIHSEWASEPMEQLPPFTRRRHRPYSYEFVGAEFWPWTTRRAKLEAEREGTECRPEAFPDWAPMRPRDPPADEATEEKPPGGEGCKGPCGIPTEELNPQARARLLLAAGWYPNPWKKLWGATVNDNPIIHCENCNCYVLPPVPNLAYMNAHHEKSSCFKERGCYYNCYTSKRCQPPTGTTWNSEYGKFNRLPDSGPPVDQSYGCPPHNWWITEVRTPYIPPPPDYDLLSPSVGAPPKHSIYEINSVSRVISQWTP